MFFQSLQTISVVPIHAHHLEQSKDFVAQTAAPVNPNCPESLCMQSRSPEMSKKRGRCEGLDMSSATVVIVIIIAWQLWQLLLLLPLFAVFLSVSPSWTACNSKEWNVMGEQRVVSLQEECPMKIGRDVLKCLLLERGISFLTQGEVHLCRHRSCGCGTSSVGLPLVTG